MGSENARTEVLLFLIGVSTGAGMMISKDSEKARKYDAAAKCLLELAK